MNKKDKRVWRESKEIPTSTSSQEGPDMDTGHIEGMTGLANPPDSKSMKRLNNRLWGANPDTSEEEFKKFKIDHAQD